MTGDPQVTRRGMLALTGATALAGCGALSGLTGEEAVELDADAVAHAVAGEPPSVAEPLPVDVGDEYVTASREQAESALASAPLPLSPDELPNGAMREQLAHEVEHARDLLDSASEAPGVRERLGDLRHAREHARFVAAAWAYTTDDVTLADVRERAETVRTDARSVREEWAYVGRDPVRALLVHEAVESWTAAAERYATFGGPEFDRHAEENAIRIGERAGEVEHGEAYLADATRVGDRFTASLSDPPSVRSTLVAARESLTEAIESRTDDLPDPDVRDPNELADADRDLEGAPAGEALDDLHWRTPRAFEQTDDLAGDVLDRSRGLAYAEALVSLRQRVEDGETFAVESADDVRDRREAAVSAFETALDESDDERLARSLLADHVGWIAETDRDLGRYSETVNASSLDHSIGTYVAVASYARAVPAAVAETLDALDAD